MKLKIENITPEKATSWLRHNRRPIKKHIVDKYAQDMQRGHWKLTHQGIAFNKKGECIDGQHRLSAIIKSNTTTRMAVITDVDEDSFDVMDTGSARTRADILAIEGLEPRIARIISPAVPYIVNFEQSGTLNKMINARKQGNPNIVIREFIEARPEIVDSANYVLTLPRRDSLLPDSQLCFLHFVINKRHDDAERFLYLLTTGDGVGADSPIFEIRRQLLSSKMHRYIQLDVNLLKRVIVAYNFFHSGKQLKDWRQALYHTAAAMEKVVIE